ncbi:esterase/lipase family protein [Desulfolucanica intricata]|uniref:esterase/lipase family protein n=1 Tax=Desulfolucanica intricata TaxID=1285191 RepID=UPI00082DD264|nr:alpha/beta hydrolase [Desulfolucanica intricata]
MKYIKGYVPVFFLVIILVSVLPIQQLFDPDHLVKSENQINNSSNQRIINQSVINKSVHRSIYIVLIKGLGTECNGTRYGNIGFSSLRKKLTLYGFQYRDRRFLQYSYTGGEVKAGEWYPNKYSPEDTGQPIGISVKHLNDLIEELSAADPKARFILVGHSLGGVIAFDFISKYTENISRIKGVVTLNAPLMGAIYNIPNIVLEIFQNNGSVWGSIAVRELILQNEFKVDLENLRRQTALKLQKNGIHLATFATQQDLIVHSSSAFLRDINKKPITEGNIISVSRLEKLPYSLYGHRQILNEALIADYIISILET